MSEAEASEGFSPLFDGRDLEGWTGNLAGYAAEDGKIVVHPERGGGNLYTAKEYTDFVLRFEFKLTPAANNGLGIRAPLEGDAAYVGMELQILEDGSPVYWDLQPYQYHGSIYGVVPARRGVLRPVGEWNTEEVTVKGRRVTVVVNGVTVVDADLDEASASGTMDGKDHPGLKRTSGHIGFLGHGSIVELRNIRINGDPVPGHGLCLDQRLRHTWRRRHPSSTSRLTRSRACWETQHRGGPPGPAGIGWAAAPRASAERRLADELDAIARVCAALPRRGTLDRPTRSSATTSSGVPR